MSAATAKWLIPTRGSLERTSHTRTHRQETLFDVPFALSCLLLQLRRRLTNAFTPRPVVLCACQHNRLTYRRANSLHRNQVPELLRKFNLLEGLHAEHSADNIADIMAKRGLTGSYKLDPALIPKLCEPCDMITMNKPSKVVLHKLFSPRSSSLVAAEIDTFYSILGISKAKIRYIDMFQIYRIAPCCGRQFDTLGRFNRHVKACYPEVYQNLMIKDTTIAAPSNITYAKIKAKQLARKENMIAKSSQSNSAEKDQRPKFECPVCHKELSAATFLTNHIRRLHPEVQLAKMKVKRVKI